MVDDRKIVDYLLSEDHPLGADKAAFFTSIGYSKDNWSLLRDDLTRLPLQGEIVSEQPTAFGIKYVVDGLIEAPSGRHVELRTVWISDGPDDRPRLVTAYPR